MPWAYFGLDLSLFGWLNAKARLVAGLNLYSIS
jgi:hypothetical protein